MRGRVSGWTGIRAWTEKGQTYEVCTYRGDIRSTNGATLTFPWLFQLVSRVECSGVVEWVE